jgi:hypothetical protein
MQMYKSSIVMFVKVNHVDFNAKKVQVTQLDIDDYGSIIPLNELELEVSPDDDSLIQTLKNSSYAAIFTGYDVGASNNNVILANRITIDELNKEKSKVIDDVANKK